MKTAFNRFCLSVLSAMPALAFAHPGHGGLEGWAHWFTPEHVLPALVGVGGVVFLLSRKKDRE